MQDAMNALCSYLDTLKDKGVVFRLLNNNNDLIELSIVHGDAKAEYVGGLVKRTSCTEKDVLFLLEEVEKYVELIIK